MNRKKHILFLLPQLSIGGTERHLIKLVNYLSYFHKVTVLCFSSKNQSNHFLENSINNDVNLIFTKLNFPYFNFFLKIILLRLNYKIDFIHSFNYNDVKWDVWIKLIFFKAILITERRNIQHWRRSYNLSIFEKFRNHLTTTVIANCVACMDAAIKIEELRVKNQLVIYNSIIKPSNQFLFNSSDKFKIISVANIKDIKNQIELIMAFEKLNIPNKELYLIGNYDNNYSNYLFDFINSNKIKNIHFLGQQQNPDFFINSSKLFVSTSKAEGFSNSILEALSFGIPVVASNVGGNIEIIKNGFNGYIYNLGDIDDLCDKIELVYERSLNDVNLSDNCKTVLCDFSLDKMIDNYLKIYL